MRLYEATDALTTVNDWIEEHADSILASGGELPAELAALLDQAEGDLATKVERVALKVREMEATAAAIRSEAARLAQRATTATNAASSLKAYLQRSLELAGVPIVKGLLVTVTLQKNPPSVQASREPETGDQMVIIPPVVIQWDKAAIKLAAKAGDPLPEGVTVTQSVGLRIR